MKPLLILFSILSLPVFAQDLRKDKAFFEAQKPEITEWLAVSLFDKIITWDKIDVEAEKVLVKMKIPDLKNWENLDNKLKTETEKNLAETIFGKILFQMDLKPKELEIELDGKDVILVLTSPNGIVEIEKMQKMGSISDVLAISLDDIKIAHYGAKRSAKDSIQAIKKTLKMGVEKYLKTNETLFENYHFETVLDLPQQLVLEISNISGAIVADESYFEHIRLNFQFEKQKQQVNIRYDIRAKYATGIIWAPRSTAYKDVDPKYADLFRRFCDRLKNHINQTLTNEK